MDAPRQIVAGTAGHIDHGKSLLVRALTGTDPDRLKEEKERGITIDLGFANLVLEDGTRIGFVDVPGHERFVRNMLAGVGGIDLVVLVIAADESIKPQTREHFDICRLLRIPQGVIALTKSDLVDRDLLELARLEAREFVAGSFLESAPIVPVSGRTGEGLDALRAALAAAAARVPPRPARGLPRLPVDRSFTIKGFGTVVTGTLISGTLREGDEIALLPHDRRARVRGLEVFNKTTPIALPGQRTAVNLQGIDAAAVTRGDVLTIPEALEPSSLLDVALDMLPSAPGPLKDLARLRFHHGTLEAMARVRLLGRRPIAPGTTGFGQLRLETPVVALPGDRFIVRRSSPPVTIGGGVVLHNRPAKLRPSDAAAAPRFQRLAQASPAAALEVFLEERGPRGAGPAALRARTGLSAEEIAEHLRDAASQGRVVVLASHPPRYVWGPAYAGLAESVTAALGEFHAREPLREGLPREELRTRLFAGSHADVFRGLLADLAGRKVVRSDKDLVALASHRIALSAGESALLDAIEEKFRQAGANPPDFDQLTGELRVDRRQASRLFHLLLSRGRLVRIPDGRAFHAEAIDDLKRRLWEKRATSPIIDISEFKDLSGTSRKNAIPLLEHFDQVRVTRREGNRRVILPPPRATS